MFFRPGVLFSVVTTAVINYSWRSAWIVRSPTGYRYEVVYRHPNHIIIWTLIISYLITFPILLIHFHLFFKVKVLATQSYLTLYHSMEPTRFLCPWDSPGKNTGVGSHSFLQGIFLTQGLNKRFLHCRQILYYLSHQGRPLIFQAQPKCFLSQKPNLTLSYQN